MVNTDELRGLIAKNRTTQEAIAKACGISSKTFYLHMKKGVFGSDEIQTMIELLHIDDPASIFFISE